MENCGSNGGGVDWKLLTWKSNPEKFLSSSSIDRYGVALARALGVTPEEPLAKEARELAEKADAVVQAGDGDLDAAVVRDVLHFKELPAVSVIAGADH